MAKKIFITNLSLFSPDLIKTDYNLDSRIDHILQRVMKLTGPGFRPNESKKGDPLDAIIAGLSLIENKQKIESEELKCKEDRINGLIEIMLKYTMMDLSEKTVITENRDEIDALAAGLNALREELKYTIENENKLKNELEKKKEDLERQVDERTRDLQKSLKEVLDYKFALDEACIVAITDQKGTIKYANEYFCRISKYSKEELIGQDHRIINSGYHTKEFIRDLWKTIANGKVWHGELKNRAKDGTIYWVDTTIVPFLDENKKPYQYMAIRSDITGRKKAEEEINRLNEDLEKKVAARTNQLQKVNEELESFTYSVSHDLRTPLRAIHGYSQILVEEFNNRLDDEGRRVLKTIMNNAKKMGKLIDELLAFSRLGKKELKKTTLETNRIVETVLEELNAFQDYKAEIVVHPMPSVYADYTLISQVYQNLISNALKYSSKKERPKIEIGSTDANVFFVKDNGVGFDMDYYEKLFGVFQRLHGDDEFEGSGVGLATVQRVLLRHGGKIWAEGSLNEGATFYFTVGNDIKK